MTEQQFEPQQTPDFGWQPEPAAAPEVPKPKRILGMPVAGFVVVLVVVLAAVGVGAWLIFKPKPFDLSGSLTLTDDSSVAATIGQDGCHGTGGYSDVAVGAPVTVYNADSKIVGTGMIDYSTALSGTSCWMAFSVRGVPGGEGPYQYEISHRGKLTFTEAEGRGSGVTATLGNN